MVAAGLAVLLLVALAAYENGQAGSAAVLQQRLDPAVHKALLSLATNLEGELRGVQGVLSAVDGEEKVEVRGEALASKAKAEPAPSEGSCLDHDTPASTWVTAPFRFPSTATWGTGCAQATCQNTDCGL